MTGSLDAVLGRIDEIRSLLASAPATTTGSAAPFAAALAEASGAAGRLATTAALSGGTGSGGAAPSGADVVAAARHYLGVPYQWGGTDPATGLDCSGLVQRVYADLGIALPRVSGDQARAGRAVPDLARAQPGDVLAFGQPVDHVAIYIGGGQMIAAPQPGEQVKVQPVYTTPTAIRRILPEPAATTPLLRPAELAGAAGIAAALGGAGLNGAGLGGVAGTAALAGVPFASLFNQAGAAHGVSPALLAAVARAESGYDPTAVSPAGAIGLMQLMPATAAGLGVDPWQPAQAVDGAARLLTGYLGRFGTVPLALAAYNAGPAAVQRYGGVPPYAETRNYIASVQAALAALGMGGSP